MYNVTMRPTKEELIERGIEHLDKIHALDDANRIRILNIVSLEVSISEKEILQKLQIRQSTLSHHLNVLIKAKMLDSVKVGHSIYYSLRIDALIAIDKMLANMDFNFTSGYRRYKNGPTQQDIYDMVDNEIEKNR